MDCLADFLTRLFSEGRVHLRDRRPSHGRDSRRVGEILAAAYAIHSREVAGEAIRLDPDVAIQAAELVHRACWALVHRDARPADLGQELHMPHPPSAIEHHLSADLTLRYLPQVHRRAKAIDPSDVLTERLEGLFREWPLSGVLSDLEAGPSAPPDFPGHPGLMLLYAERLARHERIGWRPSGRTRESLEMVLREMGRDRSPLLMEHGGLHG